MDLRRGFDGGLRLAIVVVFPRLTTLDYRSESEGRGRGGDAHRADALLAANGGREIRSLSIHPNGSDWLFVECVERIHQRCDVMRYQLKTGRLYRYGLPEGFRYTYAHYSPQGRYIVMSRRKIPGDSEDEERRSLDESEIALMPSEGGVLAIIPAARNKLSPFMSLDETRIAFWRSARLLPPGRRVRLLEFDLWEFDLSRGTERPFSGLFKFVEGDRRNTFRTTKFSSSPTARPGSSPITTIAMGVARFIE